VEGAHKVHLVTFMDRVLIIGATGLLGSALVNLFPNAYFTFNKTEIDAPSFFRLDISDQDALTLILEKVRPETVIVTAAMTDVDRCELNPEMAYKINALPFFTIVKYLSRVGGRIIQVSTDYVFSGEVGGYREYDKREPINVYGKSKMEAEDIITNSGISYAIVRTSGIFGVKESSGKINFFLWVYKNLCDEREISIVKDQYYSPTLNTSLASAIVEMYSKNIDGVFHFSSVDRISRHEFALLVANAFSRESNLIRPSSMSEMKWIAKRPRDSSLNNDRAMTILTNKPLRVAEEIELAKKEMLK